MNNESNGLYVIYDKIAKRHGPIFESVNHLTAKRAVRQMKFPYPEDYELICLGLRDGDQLTIVPKQVMEVSEIFSEEVIHEIKRK